MYKYIPDTTSEERIRLLLLLFAGKQSFIPGKWKNLEKSADRVSVVRVNTTTR